MRDRVPDPVDRRRPPRRSHQPHHHDVGPARDAARAPEQGTNPKVFYKGAEEAALDPQRGARRRAHVGGPAQRAASRHNRCHRGQRQWRGGLFRLPDRPRHDGDGQGHRVPHDEGHLRRDDSSGRVGGVRQPRRGARHDRRGASARSPHFPLARPRSWSPTSSNLAVSTTSPSSRSGGPGSYAGAFAMLTHGALAALWLADGLLEGQSSGNCGPPASTSSSPIRPRTSQPDSVAPDHRLSIR